MPEPITPTRIIPPGAALPARPPAPGEVPPWWDRPNPIAHPNPDPPRTRTGPPAPPAHPNPEPAPEPANPGPIEVRITFEPEPVEPEPAPGLWDRVRGVAPVWKILAALAAAVAPIPGVGYSVGAIWAYCVGEARADFGPAHGYALALVPLLLAGRAFFRTRALRWLFALVVALIGLTGALHWFDPITALTGVHPR
jgi:hypothetical protein